MSPSQPVARRGSPNAGMRHLAAGLPCPLALTAPPAWRTAALAWALLAGGCGEPVAPLQVADGDAARGRAAIERVGCTACHTIPGIASHGAQVGPPLVSLRERGYLGGVLPNTPQNMVRWLRHPTEVAPLTAMPDLGLTEAEAADIAASLYERHP